MNVEIIVISHFKDRIIAKCYISYVGGINFSRGCPEAYDYLRSKGYALPWMGLSVEKLIEYG